jgi:hypothetical protein
LTDAPEQLTEKADEYTILSAWHDERAVARGEYAEAHAGAALGFALVAIALREVADALTGEGGA